MVHLTSGQVEEANLEALGMLQVLYDAYRGGRLYAYASREDLERDLKFRDELVEKTLDPDHARGPQEVLSVSSDQTPTSWNLPRSRI